MHHNLKELIDAAKALISDRHTHNAAGKEDADVCADCGNNIRNAIHYRSGESIKTDKMRLLRAVEAFGHMEANDFNAGFLAAADLLNQEGPYAVWSVAEKIEAEPFANEISIHVISLNLPDGPAWGAVAKYDPERGCFVTIDPMYSHPSKDPAP